MKLKDVLLGRNAVTKPDRALGGRGVSVSEVWGPNSTLPPNPQEEGPLLEPSCAVDEDMSWCSHCGEQHGGHFKKCKQSYHVTLQSHSWAYIQRKTRSKKIHAPQCSRQHCLQWPRCGSNMNVHQQSVQSLTRVRLFATPRTAARQASLTITNSRSLLKLMSVESVMPSNHLILCRPLHNFSILALRTPSAEGQIQKMWYIGAVRHYSTIRKNEIMPFTATWMNMQSVLLSEVTQAEKEKYYMTSLICGILKEMIQMNLLTKQKETQDLENELMVAGGRDG